MGLLNEDRAAHRMFSGAVSGRAFRKRRKYIPVGSDGDILSPTVSKGPAGYNAAVNAVSDTQNLY
jgi:hypothetical protein